MADRLYLDPRDAPLLARCGLDRLEAFFAWSQGGRLDKPGLGRWRQRWRLRLSDPAGAVHTYYLKRFSSPPTREQIRRWLTGHAQASSAAIEWWAARQLADAGVPAVEAAAFGQVMAGTWERRSFVLLRNVPGESLERWVPVHLRPVVRPRGLTGETPVPQKSGDGLSVPTAEKVAPAGRRVLVETLADVVGRFHEAGFAHRDLYLCHVFIHPDWRTLIAACGEQPPTATEPLFRLIDLQRVFRPRWRCRRWAVKDLAALDFSTPAECVGRWERLRFLCRYVRVCGRFGTARQLAKLIVARSGRLARRQGRKQFLPP